MIRFRRGARQGRASPKIESTPSLDNLMAELDSSTANSTGISVVYMTSGLCSVIRNGLTIVEGVSNAEAWATIDRLDHNAGKMEDARLRIGDAFSRK